MSDWDYEIPHRCEYGVEVRGYPHPVDCEEPAPVLVQFDDGAKMWVCVSHLNFMTKVAVSDED